MRVVATGAMYQFISVVAIMVSVGECCYLVHTL